MTNSPDFSASRALSDSPSSPRTSPDYRRRTRFWHPGEVAEWSNAPHSKCGIGASLSGVRIPPSPPYSSCVNSRRSHVRIVCSTILRNVARDAPSRVLIASPYSVAITDQQDAAGRYISGASQLGLTPSDLVLFNGEVLFGGLGASGRARARWLPPGYREFPISIDF